MQDLQKELTNPEASAPARCGNLPEQNRRADGQGPAEPAPPVHAKVTAGSFAKIRAAITSSSISTPQEHFDEGHPKFGTETFCLMRSRDLFDPLKTFISKVRIAEGLLLEPQLLSFLQFV